MATKKAEMKSEEEKPLTVVELTAENVLRLKAITIRPKGPVVTIEGANASGKTSTLHCISMALGGKDLCPERPIRDGEKEAFVALNLGEFTVTRRWTSNENSTLKIERKDGKPVTSPQAFLDAAVGRLSWNPLEFTSMKPADRLAALRTACGIDTSEEDADHKAAYEERRDVNRDLDRVKKELTGLEGTPESIETRPLSEIRPEYDRAVKANAEIDNAETKLAEKREEYARVQKEIKDRQKRLDELKLEADELTKVKEKPKKDVRGLRAEMEAAEAAAETRGKIERKAEAIKERTKYEKEVARLEKTMAEATAEKERKIREANLPGGLGIGDEDVTLNGRPFSQASRAESLRASVAVGMQGSPKIRIMLIEEASCADANTMAEIEKLAKEHGAQVWCEVVKDAPSGRKNALYILDGSVAE